jgi:phospholipase D1/2
MPRANPGRRVVWIKAAAVLAVCGLLVAAWTWSPVTAVTLDRLASWLAPHRHAWYAPPLVMLAFVTLGLVMVPVLLLIAVTGVVFGPILGPLYALAGSLASASVGFAIGRWIGLRRVEELGGERVTRLARAVKRNGTLAVFLVRKVPAPFTLANIVVGASTVRYRDFFVGTVLGMGFFVIALAGFGYQLSRAWHNPSPETLFATLMLLAIPLTLAWFINRALREKAAG